MTHVVITGGAHGLGSALADGFARAGDDVAVLDLDAEAATSKAAALSAAGGEALGIGCDVTSAEDCRSAVDQVTSEWGGIDILVANAGITHMGRVAETRPEVIRRVMSVNFFGAVNCAQAALPSLLQRRGQLVAISSVAGFAPLATRAGYAASKHAVEGFFGTLRTEHAADGLGVTLVRPSFVRTGIGQRALGVDGRPAGEDARTGVSHELTPAAAAKIILRGVSQRRRVVWVGREARLAWWLWRSWPWAYERQMVRRTMLARRG